MEKCDKIFPLYFICNNNFSVDFQNTFERSEKKTFLQHYHRFSYILFRHDLQNIVKKTKKQFLFQ